MIEMLIIAIIAGAVLYYLYQTLMEYLGNENNQNRFLQKPSLEQAIEQEPTVEEKIRSSEYGNLIGILGYVANADGEICLLEQNVAKSMMSDMADELSKIADKSIVLPELEKIFFEQNKNIQNLCRHFCDLTKGEYKKRLKVVEFCFVLGYADGKLNDATKEAIIDVGALLELDNQDFNQLYESFSQENEINLSLEEAQEIFGNLNFEDQNALEKKYLDLIASAKQNFGDDETLKQWVGKDQLLNLRKIHKAYEILKSENS